MAMTHTTTAHAESLNPSIQGSERRTLMYSMGSSSGVEALAAIGGVTLAILGLAGVLPFVFAAISAIVIGAGLMLEGLAIAAIYAEEMRRELVRSNKQEVAQISGGLSAQTLGGAAGVTLGILALVGVAPATLLGVTAIVFGASLLLGGPARPELVNEEIATAGDAADAPRNTGRAIKASGSGMALAGLASLALGVLGLAGVGPMLVLVLVAFLVAGGASLLGGSALLGRVIGAIR